MATYTKQNTVVNAVPPNYRQKTSLRIRKAKYSRSGPGNPMIAWELEVVDPLEVDIDGQKYNLDGSTFTKFIVLKSEKQDNAGIMVNIVHPRLGLPEELQVPDNSNEDTDPDKCPNVAQYEGIVFDAMLGTKNKTAQNRTDAGYTPVLDENGRPVSLGFEWNLNIDARNGVDIIGLSTTKLNTTY